MITIAWWVLVIIIFGSAILGLLIGGVLGDHAREDLRATTYRLRDLAIAHGIPDNEINEAEGVPPWS